MTRQEITEFYERHHRRLYNISFRLLRDSAEAEEVMQDTILKFAGRPLLRFGSEAQISAWLARTCIRASIDRLRRRQRYDAFLEDYAHEFGDSPVEPANDGMVEPANDGMVEPANDGSSVIPGEDPEPRPDIVQVRAAMDALPEPYRLVLNLVLIEGLDYEEIAALTGKKETTLRSLYSRGLVKLQTLLQKI